MSERNVREFEPSGGFSDDDNAKIDAIERKARKKKWAPNMVSSVMRAYFRRTYPDEFAKWDKGKLTGRIKRIQGEGMEDL